MKDKYQSRFIRNFNNTRNMLHGRLSILEKIIGYFQIINSDTLDITVEAMVNSLTLINRAEEADFINNEFEKGSSISVTYSYGMPFLYGSIEPGCSLQNSILSEVAWRGAIISLENRSCEIIGHATAGEELSQSDLAIKRAAIVSKNIALLGIVPARIKIRSHDNNCEICSFHKEEGDVYTDIKLLQRTMSSTTYQDLVNEKDELSSFLSEYSVYCANQKIKLEHTT